MSDDSKPSMAWRAVGGLSAVAAALVTRNVLEKVWEMATGKEPPANPEHPDVTWREAASWAVLSGVLVALARLYAQRQAARAWVKARGELPPGLGDVN